MGRGGARPFRGWTMTSIWRSPIFRSLFVRFLLAAIMPLFTLNAITDHLLSRSLQTHIQNKLIAISDARSVLIDAQLTSIAEFTTARAMLPTTIAAFREFDAAFKKAGIHSEDYQALDSRYRDYFQQYLDIHGYLHDLLFISRAGDIIFTVKHENDLGENIHGALLKNTSLSDLVDQVQHTFSAEISDLKFYPPTHAPALFVAAPVFIDESLSGTLVTQVKNEFLNDFSRDYSGLPKTGEFTFAAQIGNNPTYTTPSRLQPTAPLSRQVHIGAPISLPSQACLRGESGIGLTRDYRGVTVLARWQHIPRLRWGMVVKADVDELFAPLKILRISMWSICLLMSVTITTIALRAARSIAEPINELKRGIKAVGRGNLDYRTKLQLDNELGELSMAFDKMTEDIQTQIKIRMALEKDIAERMRVEEILTLRNKESKETESALMNILEDLDKSQSTLQKNNMTLVSLTENLTRSNQELEDFAYIVSHDLKAPLRGISSLSTWLATDYADKLDDEGRHHLQLLQQRAIKMDQLINGILQYSQVQRKQETHLSMDLDGLLDEALELVAPPPGIRIIRTSQLPRVRCSPTRIQQVFQNLVDNAIKYMGKETGEIKISCLDKNDHWQFCVEDNGQGIAEKHFDKIFKIFHTIETPGQKQSTGIGLALVHKVVTLHGGKVWVESQLGAGSKFFFTLPKTA